MIDRQEFKLLVCFKTVYELESFSKASDFLLRSQPSVSFSIRQLEEQLGILLFDRTSRQNIVPTDAAHILYKKVNELLEIWNDTVYRINEISNHNTYCRIGASTAASVEALPSIVKTLSQNHQSIDIKINIDLSESLYTSIRNHELDLALVEIDVTENKHVRVIPLINDPLVLAGSATSNTWLLNTTRTSINQINEDYLFRNSIEPSSFIHVNSNYALLDLLESGVGCSIVSKSSIKNRNIEYTLLGDKYTRKISLIMPNPSSLAIDEINQTLTNWIEDYRR